MRAFMTTVAILVAGSLAACTGSPGVDPTAVETPTATPTVTPSPTSTATLEATPSATVSPTQGGPLGDAEECENEELGYEVDYPGDWWANARIEPEDDNLTPIPACQYFAPNEVELQPNAGLPNGIAVRIEMPEQPIDPSEGGEIIAEDDATVDDREARVVETEPDPQPGFVPEGSFIYRYIVELDDGRQLIATTDNILQDDARYEESKAIMDAMMATLELDD